MTAWLGGEYPSRELAPPDDTIRIVTMMNFLFWNMARQNRLAALSRLVSRHAVDFLVLAECCLEPRAVIDGLKHEGRMGFHYNPSQCRRIALYSKFPSGIVSEIWGGTHVTIRHLRLPQRTDVILVAVHLESKLHQSKESQALACTDLAFTIRDAESKLGHCRTVLVGDLNMNPFEPGVVGAGGLHAVMDRRIVERGTRIVDGSKRMFFYNPMWSFLGDSSPGPPGTYYRSGTEHVTYFWNMFDQVLVRPDLLSYFRGEDVQILAGDGMSDFVSKNGIPNKGIASDHLPVLFRLDL